MGYSLTDTSQIQDFTEKTLKAIDNGVLEAAYKIRDKVRDRFVNNGKYHNLSSLKEGIMLGRYFSDKHQIKLHAFGYNDKDKKTFKARFFEGGTDFRYTKKYKGKRLSSKEGGYKGVITPISALDEVKDNINTLSDIIKKHIQDGK